MASVFSVTPTSGSSGTTKLTVSAGANTGRTSRTGSMILKTSGGKTVTVPVMQYGTPAIELTSDSATIDANTGSKTFRVASFYPFTIEHESSDGKYVYSIYKGSSEVSSSGSGPKETLQQAATGGAWVNYSISDLGGVSSGATVSFRLKYTDLDGKSHTVPSSGWAFALTSASITVDTASLTDGSLLLDCNADSKEISVTSNVDFTASVE